MLPAREHSVMVVRTSFGDVALKPWKPRSEAKIRAELAMQFEDIIGNFERQVELDRAREPI